MSKLFGMLAEGRWKPWAVFGLLGVFLGLHIHHYWFLTDDAFISFRYARNLAEGAGLTYNPGSEAVEGYTNFLWTVLLASFARLGWPPEQASLWVSVLATSVLWLGASVFGLRLLHRGRWSALGLLAPLALTINRSFAVWSTSGLETRLVELLVLGGLAAVVVDLQRPGRIPGSIVLPSGLFALAVLTRPDVILIGGSVFVARDLLLWRRGRFYWRRFALSWLVFMIPIGAHVAWRLSYYGYPLPNTYYAKLAGQTAPAQGLLYVAFFVVEYALVLWIPFLIAGVRMCRERAAGLTTLAAAAFGPYLVYVVYAGGDHFEFRLLDMLLVPLALLFQAGVARKLGHTRGTLSRGAVLAVALAVLACSTALPTLSNLDFPKESIPGFPGFQGRSNGDQSLIQMEAVPGILRLPGVRLWIESYNALARRLTRHYAALRQESHRQATEMTMALGRELRRFVDEGYIPGDTRIAVHAAGAIPYFSRLWTLDRLGLCDVHVAHSRPGPGPHMMAHSKLAEPWYIAMKGVDLNAVHPYSFIVNDRIVQRTKTIVTQMGSPNYLVVRLGPDSNFLAHFPQGPQRGLAKFPRMNFIPIGSWEPEVNGDTKAGL